MAKADDCEIVKYDFYRFTGSGAELEVKESPPEWFVNDKEYKLYSFMVTDETNYDQFLKEYQKLYGDQTNSTTITKTIKFELFAEDDGAYSKEAEYYKKCLEETRESLSYIVGRAIICLP